MSALWQSYVPYYVTQDLVRHPDAEPVGRELRFDAVVLFADVSGFTAISEALGAAGRRGTEELTTILNSYFGPMINLIRSYGGNIGKFGGDAMTVLFPYDEDSYRDVACRSVRCALDMQGNMSEFKDIRTSVGSFSLAMKAGLAAGPLFCTTVGEPDMRLEYLITGSVLDRCADAEHHARSGEVVVDLHLHAAIQNLASVLERNGFLLVESMAGQLPGKPLVAFDQLPSAAVETIAAYMHPSIAQRIRERQTSFINEHRKVTILFLSFQGFDYDRDPQVGDKLQQYLSQVIQIVHRFDGYLNKVDMGDKGSKAIILFGAPIAHEDDEERALRCSLEIRDIAGIPVRVGVNTGFVYCGQVGSDVRQEYTVMGDAVNLAARLMQAAKPGQILVSAATHSAAATAFTWEEEVAIQVKGKADLVKVHTLVQPRKAVALQLQEPDYALPMVGRQRELAEVQDRLARVKHGQGQIVGITAEAGMGKSRLAAEVIKLATSEGLVGYGGECLSHGVNTAYLVWRNLLRGLFGLDSNWTVEDQIAHLISQLATIDAGIEQRAPLLGRALNLAIPDNNLTRPLDAKLRKASLEALLVDCIRYRAQEHPLLLVLEDCHWIDALSNDLLEVVGRNIADVPVFMLVIYRPSESERIQPQVLRFGHFHEIRLSEFNPQEAEELIGLKLASFFGADTRVPREFVERITNRAQGNPFYIDEMINLIRDKGIRPDAIGELQSLDLPDSLHSLIISRLDQLAEGPKTTLKVASVIGRLFNASWLWSVYPQLGAPERVKEQLSLLSRLDITPLDKSEAQELEYLFKHIVTREVAYESLSVATRRMLHREIGSFIERRYPEDTESYIDLLAYHFGLSADVEKQKTYFRRAGDLAKSSYANEAAIDYYQRLLPLLPEESRSEILLELGQVLQLIGRWSEAEQTFTQALEVAERGHDTAVQAGAQQVIGTLMRFKAAYTDALEWLGRAQSAFERQGNKSGFIDATREIGIIHWFQGNYSLALQCYEQCLQIADELGDQQGIFRAIGNIGGIHWAQGDYEQALSAFAKCHQIASELGDRMGLGIVYGNMGNVYLDQGDYSRALSSHARYLQMAQEVGYVQGIGISVGNMGEVYEKQGDYRYALDCFGYSLRAALEIGDRVGVATAVWSMARVDTWQGRYADARRLIDQAIALGRALDTPYELCEYLYTSGYCHMRKERYAESLAHLDESVLIAQDVSNREVYASGLLLAARLRALTGEEDPGHTVRRLESLLDEWTDDAELAATHYEIWRLAPEQEKDRIRAAELYGELYAQTPNVNFKHRYERLTGETLPDPPPLPSLPEIVTRRVADLETLVAQIDALIGELKSSPDH